MQKIKTNICIIGAGSGGLSVAAGAAQMGASVVLIEKAEMGGDCLNTGCVPSKSLLAAARIANTFRQAEPFGIKAVEPEIDYQKVHHHVHAVINKIASNDSVERFESFGVKVIKATGKFTDTKTIIAGDYEIKARRFVIATGSSAATPPIEGLDQINYLTNENIFNLTEKPEHLIVIGGGPIGCEMAQAHLLLGSKVTLLDIHKILPKDDAELVDIARQSLVTDGLNLFEQIEIVRVEKTEQGVAILFKQHGKEQRVEGSTLLVATGRKPNFDELELEKANIEKTHHGIKTNKRLRSVSNRRVYAVGDAAGSCQFTHIASYHAGIVIQNILFGIPAKVDYRAIPWATYLEPELAHVGMTERDACHKKLKYKTLFWSLEENDRAQTERQTKGKIKVILNHNGKILGCSIIAPHAGDLILPWGLAIQNNMKISKMANLIAPYPTLSEASKRVAGSYYTDLLFSNRTKKIVRFIQKIIP